MPRALSALLVTARAAATLRLNGRLSRGRQKVHLAAGKGEALLGRARQLVLALRGGREVGWRREAEEAHVEVLLGELQDLGVGRAAHLRGRRKCTTKLHMHTARALHVHRLRTVCASHVHVHVHCMYAAHAYMAAEPHTVRERVALPSSSELSPKYSPACARSGRCVLSPSPPTPLYPRAPLAPSAARPTCIV